MKIKSSRRIEQADDPVVFETLSQRPVVAWPTVILLLGAYALYGCSVFAYVQGAMPLLWAIVLNTVAAYLSFTPAHEASHNTVSTHRRLNEWVGRLSTALQSPVPFFRTFRYIHMQHHRFTNDRDRDPDIYVGTGPAWLLPLKWATLDLSYFFYYFRPSVFRTRPLSERRELFLALMFGMVIFALVALAGWVEYYLLLFFLPTRITVVILALTFDFLPHYPHQMLATDDPYQSTKNRTGMKWLLTPLLLYQNYHLVHHLYPTVPFYRYIKVWRARKQYHESRLAVYDC
jgi:fatty acid desaturase